jgi:hypothetical protein
MLLTFQSLTQISGVGLGACRCTSAIIGPVLDPSPTPSGEPLLPSSTSSVATPLNLRAAPLTQRIFRTVDGHPQNRWYAPLRLLAGAADLYAAHRQPQNLMMVRRRVINLNLMMQWCRIATVLGVFVDGTTKASAPGMPAHLIAVGS